MCDVGFGGSHVCCRPWGAVMCVVGRGGQSCVM